MDTLMSFAKKLRHAAEALEDLYRATTPALKSNENAATAARIRSRIGRRARKKKNASPRDAMVKAWATPMSVPALAKKLGYSTPVQIYKHLPDMLKSKQVKKLEKQGRSLIYQRVQE